MAGNGSRGGASRSAGGTATLSKQLGLKAVERQSNRIDRLQSAIGSAARQMDQLRARRRNVVREGAFSQAMDSRIARLQRLTNRLQEEKGQLQQRDLKRRERLSRMKSRRSNLPDFPANWPTGRQLWSGSTSMLGPNGKLR